LRSLRTKIFCPCSIEVWIPSKFVPERFSLRPSSLYVISTIIQSWNIAVGINDR
jgi:hypothetical protein